MPGGAAGAAAAYKAAKAGECYPWGQAVSPLASVSSQFCRDPFLGGRWAGRILSPNPPGLGEATSRGQTFVWGLQLAAQGPPASRCSLCDPWPLPLPILQGLVWAVSAALVVLVAWVVSAA